MLCSAKAHGTTVIHIYNIDHCLATSTSLYEEDHLSKIAFTSTFHYLHFYKKMSTKETVNTQCVQEIQM